MPHPPSWNIGSIVLASWIMSQPSKLAVLIDPVLEMVERDLEVLKGLGATLVSVLNTHVHADHVTGSGRLRALYGGDVKSVLPATLRALVTRGSHSARSAAAS